MTEIAMQPHNVGLDVGRLFEQAIGELRRERE